jgi:lipopolysaccharide/colanic/teichoic acid biosynthesis glycosyltransferase
MGNKLDIMTNNMLLTNDLLTTPKVNGASSLSHLENKIRQEAGNDVLKMISKFVDVNDKNTQIFSTSTVFNIEKFEKRNISAVVNLKRINDLRRVNKFLEAINENIAYGTTFIGCVETLELRKERILNKFPNLINRLYLAGDYIFKRVLPKLPITKQVYFALTNGRNRIISRAETLGRLYSCGFEIIHEETHGYLFYFIARKVSPPAYDMSPSYGPLFAMARSGKNGKCIKVYKFRTMYPFSEYLQPYIYEKNKLDNGGKFKDDFRVTDFGKFMRRFWLDELPMLYNLLKFELKLVGVRPLSLHYQSLYPEELLNLRHQFKPGLVPPYYADMPKNFDEILESERRYLESYKKSALLTDFIYFWKAFTNIVFRNARSK